MSKSKYTGKTNETWIIPYTNSEKLIQRRQQIILSTHDLQLYKCRVHCSTVSQDMKQGKMAENKCLDELKSNKNDSYVHTCMTVHSLRNKYAVHHLLYFTHDMF